MLADDAISGDRNVIKKEDGMVNFSPCNRNKAHVECKNKSDTSNNEGNWNFRKSFKYLMNKRNKELQNTATLGTAHILREVKV